MRTAALAWLLVLTAGCARSHVEPEGGALRDRAAAGDGAHAAAGRGGAGGDAGQDPQSPSQGDPSPNHPLQGGAGASARPVAGRDAAVPATGSAGSAGAPEGEPPIASEPRQVWIGQIWSIAPLLCDPNAPWSDTPLIVQPTGYTERVVLILDLRDDPAQPSGVIAFGEGELPAVPEIPTGGDPGSFWLCSIQIPSKGGEYTVLDARRSNDRLTFGILPSEIWNAFCGDGAAGCDCDSLPGGCMLVGQRIFLDFFVTGDEMQTTFLSAAFGTAGELRLRRVE